MGSIKLWIDAASAPKATDRPPPAETALMNTFVKHSGASESLQSIEPTCSLSCDQPPAINADPEPAEQIQIVGAIFLAPQNRRRLTDLSPAREKCQDSLFDLASVSTESK
jgi:hypothetical protein